MTLYQIAPYREKEAFFNNTLCNKNKIKICEILFISNLSIVKFKINYQNLQKLKKSIILEIILFILQVLSMQNPISHQNYSCFWKKTLLSISFCLLIAGSLVFATNSTSKVPNEYFANYQIQKEWKRLSELFIEIDADSRIGKI